MITFEVEKRWEEKDVAGRMAHLIEGHGKIGQSDNAPPWRKDNGSWQLDSGNDWFLHKTQQLPNTNFEYTLDYRYTTADRQKMLDGLLPFLEFIFSPRP